jgi:SET domain-containing protein
MGRPHHASNGVPNQLPKIVRQRSSVHGFGVFAAEPVTRHTRIIDYAGELIRNEEDCEAREERYLKDGCIWVFRVNRAWSRDANVGGNVARFINHSCAPNCYFRGGRQDDLDSRQARDPSRRRADVRLRDHRRAHHSVPM